MKVNCTSSSFAFCVCWSNCSSVKGVEGSTSLSSSRDVAKEPQPTRAESPRPGIPQAVPRNDSRGGSSRSPRSRPSRPPGPPPPPSPEAGGPGPATFQKIRAKYPHLLLNTLFIHLSPKARVRIQFKKNQILRIQPQYQLVLFRL